MNRTDNERRIILIVSAFVLLAFGASCYALGTCQMLRPQEIAPLTVQPPTIKNGAEWRLAREGRGDGAATKKIYADR